MKPSYCTQNDGACSTCALSSYGRDCQNNPVSPDPKDVRAARQAAGLTQEKAAEIIGATRRAWQEWECGRRNMPGAKWELFQIKNREKKMETRYTHCSNFGVSAAPSCADGEGYLGYRDGYETLPPAEWTDAERWIDGQSRRIQAWRDEE